MIKRWVILGVVGLVLGGIGVTFRRASDSLSGQAEASELFDKLKGESERGSSESSGSSSSASKQDSTVSSESSSSTLFDRLSGESSSEGQSNSSQPKGHSTFFDKARSHGREGRPSAHVPSHYHYYPYYYDYCERWAWLHPVYDPYPRYGDLDAYREALRGPEARVGMPYYGREAVPGSPEETLRDVTWGWMNENVDLIMRHVRQGSKIKVYVRRKFSHEIEADVFYNLTLDAFERLETVRFTFVKWERVAQDRFYARAEHVFFDEQEEKQKLYLLYAFERPAGEETWYLTRLSFEPPKGSGSANCFIATAAYGTAWEPQVLVLRRFRDEFLLTNTLGEWLVALYYRVSPPLAAQVAQYESLRAVVRWTLTPVVWVCRQVLARNDASPGRGKNP